MALFQSDELRHNNPNLAVVDSDFSKGGFRTAVADVTGLYALSGKTDEPSAAGQLKEYATIVYVTGETKYYVLVDINNVDNASGWEEFQTGGGGGVGTITGATNGLTLAGVSGATIILGGALTGNTVINASGNDFTFSNIGDFQVSSGLSTVFGINNEGLSFTFSGGSISYLDNGGIKYATDYSTNYTARSLIDKGYADAILSGLKPKQAVLAATNVNVDITGGTFGGIIDGYSVQDTDRILIKDQTNQIENGIYIYSGGSNTFYRSADFDGSPSSEVVSGSYTWVLSGDTHINSSWVLITPDPITVGVTALQFAYFNHIQDIVGGHGITVIQTGSTHVISVDGNSLAGNSLSWSGTTGNETYNVDVGSGTLSTALGAKLNVTDFNVYSGNTETNISSKLSKTDFTGYTATTINNIGNVGSGSQVYSGTSGTTALFRSIIGSGDTTVSAVNGEIIISSVGSGATYNGKSPSICPTGGMCAGTSLTGKTALEILQEILAPELYGVLTSPSFSTTLVAPTIYYEVGCSIGSLDVCGTFSRGSINPQYDSASPYRSGLPYQYVYTGPQVSGTYSTTASTISQTVNSYVVSATTETWGITVSYSGGTQPIGDGGTPFDSPYPAGSLSNSKTICGVFPLFATTSTISTLTKQSLMSMNTGVVQLVLKPESGGNKQKFEIPDAWYTAKPLLCICTFNTFSNNWEFEGGSGAASLTTWTPTGSTETLLCGVTPYCLFTYNGAQRTVDATIRLVF